jgi:glycosyltransferase 2 family protein
MTDGGERSPERAPLPPRPSRRLFATPASEPRARRVTDVILVVSTIVGLAIASAAEFPAPGFIVAFEVFLRSAPKFLETGWQICADLLALFAVVVLVASLVRRRFDVTRDIVASIIVATIVWFLVGRWAQGEWPAVWSSLRSAQPPSWYPSPRIAVPAAVTASPHLTRPIRHVGRWLISLGCLAVVALGAASLLGAFAGVLVGTASASIVHLLFGSSAGRPSLHDVERALSKMGIATRTLSPADRQPEGLFQVLAEDVNGEQLVVKVYGRDAHDSAVASTLWRTLWYREPGSPLRIGRLQQVEHEALVTLLAAQFGVLTDRVVTAGATVDDDAVLVLRRGGSPLASIGDPHPMGAGDVVNQLWEMLATLHRGGISHGHIDRDALIVHDGRLGLIDFGGAGVAANQTRLNADRAQALVTSVLLIGVDGAISAARDSLGSGGLEAMLPHLQRATLTASQRRDVKDIDLDLDDLRSAAAQAAGVEPPALQQLRRITVGTILRVTLPALAVFALVSALSGLDFEGVLDEIAAATWWLLLLGFIIAQLTRVSQSVSTLGAAPAPLPFKPVYGLQLAVSYLTIAVPSYAARVAMSVRFFQRQGIAPGAALAAGALDTMTTFFIEVIGISSLLLFTEASLDLDLDLAGAGSKAGRLLLLAGILIVVVIVAVLLIRRWRRMIIDLTKRLGTEALAVLRGLQSPRRLALLIGGNIMSEILFTLALGTFALAMGSSISFADLLLIHLTVSLLAGLVPVPGGVGVAEAILTYGLIRAGMPDEAAFAAVISYRASTFYLPPIWGFFALHWLERSRHI